MKNGLNTPGLAARAVAISWLRQCLRGQRPLDEVLHEPLPGPPLAARDRNLARLIVLTTLRRLTEIDGILAELMSRGMPRKSGDLREILQTAAAQLLFLDMPPHAVVDCAIKLARKDRNARHLKNLANAVLRNIARQGKELKAGAEAGRLNSPDWLWQSWVASYGEAGARAIAEAHLQPAPLDLSVKEDAPGWADRLGGALLPTGSVRLARAGAIPDLPGFAEGEWWVQDAAAAIPVRLFEDLSGKHALDLCAAPGGKSAQMAQAGAQVTALDISRRRLGRLAENMDRLHLNADMVAADALEWQSDTRFDAVLLDAPCSSTGTIRRHPDVQRLKTPDMIETLVPVQTSLLEKAYHRLKPGGELVYCVCSLQPEEGAERIAAFLQDHADMARKPIDCAALGLPPEALTRNGDLQLRPDMFAEQGGIDGFFISVMNRQV